MGLSVIRRSLCSIHESDCVWQKPKPDSSVMGGCGHGPHPVWL